MASKLNSLSKSKKAVDPDEDKPILITAKDTPFSVIEAYKAIRTNLQFVLSQKASNRIVVTSSCPGDGKSTTSINIAIAFSQIGKKVLLIDADLRKPTVNKKLRIENRDGLSTVLGGFCSVSEAVHNIAPDFDVMTAGTIPPNPSELLGSKNMSKLLAAMDDYYNLIIIDSPPINTVTDALVVAPKTDGLLLVIGQRKTTHDDLKRALGSIEFANATLLGAVMNGGTDTNGKGSYYSYEYK